MEDIEKLGVFYLGREIKTKHPILLESKDLTTHAVIVGMTGSGKTGLGIDLLEEAAIDGIPALIIDPKGDMGNLLLTFPELRPEDFAPWVGKEKAADTAKTWETGLKSWGQKPSRIEKVKDSVEWTIYTPASLMGHPISILNSFAAPSEDELKDNELFRDKILSTVSGLLGLIGLNADPIKSREHILISNILEKAWRAGKSLDLADLILQIQKPSFDKIGVFDTETFYPAKERMALSISLNNLLAAPGFQTWMEGDPLDIQRLLYTKEGNPRHSIISIAHLSDNERMFFVTLFLNEVIAWMRAQPGTSSLRAILYMDEIFGFFPPTAEPPSKKPMLTLLKQARAFGLGIVLATQNPVDLDYKGLANCGTWFVGKLQTERDKMRIVDGLKLTPGADAEKITTLLNQTAKRVFLLYSIHLEKPVLFETRWSLSYLQGPLTLPQIQTLSPDKKVSETVKIVSSKPAINIDELYLKPQVSRANALFKPRLLTQVKLHYVDAKNKVDTWQEKLLAFPFSDDGKSILWDQGEDIQDVKDQLTGETPKEASYASVTLSDTKNLTSDVALNLYQNEGLKLFSAPEFKLTSKLTETEDEFKARLSQAQREKRDSLIAKIKDKYQSKIQVMQDKVKRAEERVNKQQEQVGRQKFDTYLSVGATILGALLGKRATTTTINQAGTSMRRAGRIGKEQEEAEIAQKDAEAYKHDLEDLQAEFDKEIQALTNLPKTEIDEVSIPPRKSDITVQKVSLLWTA